MSDADRPDEPAGDEPILPEPILPEARRADDIPPVTAEELVDGELVDEEPEPRRYPSTIGGACYLVILLVTLVGLGIVLRGDWRVGVQTIGGSLLAAALLRLVLPAKDAGMLAVRHRALDVLMVTAVGGVLIFLARTIPT